MIARVKKGDLVFVRVGKDAGKTGVVERVYTKSQKASISGINLYKKSAKASAKSPKGGIVTKVMPIDLSNLNPICPKCQKPTRIKIIDNGNMSQRACKKCNEVFA